MPVPYKLRIARRRRVVDDHLSRSKQARTPAAARTDPRRRSDVVFVVGGVLPLLYLCWLGVRHTVPLVTMEEPEEILFTEVSEPAPVPEQA